jgi:hypothetical protein
MRPWFETITDLDAGRDALRAHRYGVIEVADGALRCIRTRPFPKVATLWGAWLTQHVDLLRHSGNQCWLYYNQPRRYPWCLTMQYIVSAREATFRTVRLALELLDEVARIKQIDTLLCDVANARVSGRVLGRWGWEPHAPMLWHRNYVKRLYQLPLEPQSLACMDDADLLAPVATSTEEMAL